MRTTFETEIAGFGNNTGIEVPPDRLAELGGSKRPPVVVDVNGYVYRSTIGSMGGRAMLALAKAHRDASGLKAGDPVTVTLELEVGDREVDVPHELRVALASAGLSDQFASLSYSKRKNLALRISEAKSQATRDRRIQAALDAAR